MPTELIKREVKTGKNETHKTPEKTAMGTESP